MMAFVLAHAVVLAFSHPAISKLCAAAAKTLQGEAAAAVEAVLSVPENPANLASRQIELPFRVMNPTAKHAIFYFEGGPGMSNLAFKPPAGLLRDFAFVQMGYRGIDGGQKLVCAALKRYLGADDPLAASNRTAISHAVEACLEQLRRREVDLAGYTVDAVVRDAEALRAALGYEKIYLLGASYGTRLALLYATAYPDHVARSVLVGANPPGNFFWSPANVSKVLSRYDRYLHAAVPETVGTSFEHLLTSVLAKAPARVFGFRADRDRLRIMTFVLLFHRSTADWVIDAYLDAYLDDDYTGLAAISFAYGLAVPRLMQWGDHIVKGISADHRPDVDYAAQLAHGEDQLGSPLSELLFAMPAAARIPHAASLGMPLKIAAETLVLAGELDLSTPAFIAHEQLARPFPSVRVLELPGYGHVGDFWGAPEATAAAITRFYAGATADAALFPELPFALPKPWGLSSLVRAAAGGAAIVLALGLALLLLR